MSVIFASFQEQQNLLVLNFKEVVKVIFMEIQVDCKSIKSHSSLQFISRFALLISYILYQGRFVPDKNKLGCTHMVLISRLVLVYAINCQWKSVIIKVTALFL